MSDPKTDCEFCKIVRGETPADVIFDDEDALAFAPLEPATKGHTLVIPKAHIPDFLYADSQTLSDVMNTVKTVATGIKKAIRPDGFNVVSSLGRAATQTVFHLHVHIVPRWENDRVGDIWPPKSSYLEETKDDVAELIRASLPAS